MSITREECEEFANAHGLALSKFADKILARTAANGGFCPCVSESERNAHPENDYQCVCSLCLKDVKELGHCHCNLIVQPTASTDSEN
jgi:ferredoxin-thioredoxin reductase catalytic subunit